MKIAISATGSTFDAEVDPRFGRCQHFIIVDPETKQFEAVDNSSAMAAGGAGISAAQMIAGKGVTAVLTGNCGPNAYQTLSAAGIQVITGVSGKVRDVVADYSAGKFKAGSQPNVPDHFGINAGPGMGGGLGRGMGRGMGRGGMGMRGSMMPPISLSTEAPVPEMELEALKAESQALAQHLADIQRRIGDLEKKK